MKITITELAGLKTAVDSMRNPLASWGKSDTKLHKNDFVIGEKDLELALKLTKAGSEHAKFLRQIRVWVNIEAPRYWWQEMDTYKFHTTQSCSTMHTLLKSGVTLSDFAYPQGDRALFELIVSRLQSLSMQYQNGGDKTRLTLKAKKILPESFIQLRSLDLNYAELLNIYSQRKNHKLPEWREFCEFIYNQLPYFANFVNAIEKENI